MKNNVSKPQRSSWNAWELFILWLYNQRVKSLIDFYVQSICRYKISTNESYLSEIVPIDTIYYKKEIGSNVYNKLKTNQSPDNCNIYMLPTITLQGRLQPIEQILLSLTLPSQVDTPDQWEHEGLVNSIQADTAIAYTDSAVKLPCFGSHIYITDTLYKNITE